MDSMGNLTLCRPRARLVGHGRVGRSRSERLSGTLKARSVTYCSAFLLEPSTLFSVLETGGHREMLTRVKFHRLAFVFLSMGVEGEANCERRKIVNWAAFKLEAFDYSRKFSVVERAISPAIPSFING